MLGPLTTQSVKAAQRRLGMKADGKVTPTMLNRLEDLAARRRSGAASKSVDAWIRHKADKPGDKS